MSESNIQKEIMLAVSRGDSRFFRANVGRGWTGNDVIKITAGNHCRTALAVGDVVLRKGRPFSTGLPTGFPDLFGWRTVVVTQEMVGQEVAIFAAIEVKSETGRVSAEQANFIDAIWSAGGYAGVARSAEQALEIVGKK